MSRQLLHWRGRVPGTKALKPPPPIPSRDSCSKLERLIQQEFEIPGLDTATTSGTSVHALKKSRLKMKPGRVLYIVMEFHLVAYFQINL